MLDIITVSVENIILVIFVTSFIIVAIFMLHRSIIYMYVHLDLHITLLSYNKDQIIMKLGCNEVICNFRWTKLRSMNLTKCYQNSFCNEASTKENLVYFEST